MSRRSRRNPVWVFSGTYHSSPKAVTLCGMGWEEGNIWETLRAMGEGLGPCLCQTEGIYMHSSPLCFFILYVDRRDPWLTEKNIYLGLRVSRMLSHLPPFVKPIIFPPGGPLTSLALSLNIPSHSPDLLHWSCPPCQFHSLPYDSYTRWEHSTYERIYGLLATDGQRSDCPCGKMSRMTWCQGS